jgi:hypothetical protein
VIENGPQQLGGNGGPGWLVGEDRVGRDDRRKV